MSEALLNELFPGKNFRILENGLLTEARSRLDSLTKPRGSLGRLEEMAARLFAIVGGCRPLRVDPALMLTVAADHGVACQKVSPFPQIVSRQMVENFLSGGAAINALCNSAGMHLRIVDAGCAGGSFCAHPLLLDRRIGNGTQDLSKGPAMERGQCVTALRNGFELAEEAVANGYACLGCGEMGIANSTAASALFCAFLGLEPEAVVGPGAGADAKMQAHKREIVASALKVAHSTLASGNPLTILAALGGFEIATLAGIMLGCASCHIPVLVDGFICTAAFVSARAFFPDLSQFAFLAHSSAEPGFNIILAQMPDVAPPLLQLQMRLGEGTGCAVALPILRAATAIFNEMTTMTAAAVQAEEKDRV